jgi:hypothetical protein
VSFGLAVGSEYNGAKARTDSIEFANSICVQIVTYQNICAIIGGMKLSGYARQMGISDRTAFR